MAADIQPTRGTLPVTPDLTQASGAPERAKATGQLVDAPRGAAPTEVVARQASPLSRSMEFVSDPSTGKMLVRILSAANGEVIRQIPSEEALELSRMVGRLNGGFVADKA